MRLTELLSHSLPVIASDVSASTLQRVYSPALKSFLSATGDKELSEYNTSDPLHWKSALSVSSRTSNIYLRHLKALWRRLVNRELVHKDIFRPLPRFKTPQHVPSALSEDQIREFISSVSNSSLKSVFLACVYTGCRVGEILALSWEDIDFARRVFTVRITKTRTGRTLPISRSFLDILQQVPKAGETVFCRSDGKRYTVGYVSHSFKKYARKAGLPDKFRLHHLRSTFATTLLMKGVDISKVSKLLGHSSILITATHYSSVMAQNLHSEVDCSTSHLAAPFSA